MLIDIYRFAHEVQKINPESTVCTANMDLFHGRAVGISHPMMYSQLTVAIASRPHEYDVNGVFVEDACTGFLLFFSSGPPTYFFGNWAK